MGRVLTASVLLAAVPAIAAGGFLGVRLAGGHDAPSQAAPAAATTESRRVAHVDLGREALALLPPEFTVHGAQNTRERRCFAGDEKHFEPCAEFMVDAALFMSARKQLILRRARERGWRHVSTEDTAYGSTLRFARGPLRATIGLGPEEPALNLPTANNVRVYDPSRRTLIKQPVTATPRGDASARRPFVTATNAACVRLAHRMRVLEKDPKRKPDEVLALFLQEWRRFVDDVSALEPPAGDAAAARSLVRELRLFPRVLEYLRDAQGEQGLAAVAAMIQQGQRIEKAFSQFGLKRCRGLTGVPPDF